MAEISRFIIEFKNSNQASALKNVSKNADMTEVLEALQLPEFNGVVTLVVAAGSMPDEINEATRVLFTKGLAPAAEKLGLIIVDGATRVGGVMAMGDARNAINGTFPAVGVIPEGVITVPDDLDFYHSHFVLVDGDNWGDESNILPGFLNATEKPGVVIIVNCRVNSAYLSHEFPLHLKWANAIIPIRNSGGVADALLDSDSDIYKMLPENATIQGIDLDKPDELTKLLESIFAG